MDNSRFFNSSQQGTSGTSAASFSHRVPLFRRVPLLQQGPVGVPLLLPFPTEYLCSAEYLCCSRVPSGYLCRFLFPTEYLCSAEYLCCSRVPARAPPLLPFPTEYLCSAEYLCCSRDPSGYLCCFLFSQSTSGLQSTSVSAGSRPGYHCWGERRERGGREEGERRERGGSFSFH